MFRWLFRRPPAAPVTKPKFARLGVHPLEDRTTPATPASLLDATFNATGIATADIYNENAENLGMAVAVQPDGKVLVAGSHAFTDIPGAYDFAVARFNVDGTLDTTFAAEVPDGVPGYFTTFFDVDGSLNGRSQVNSIVVLPDGNILLGGFLTTATTGRDAAMVRIGANGVKDVGFDGDGKWYRPTRLAGDDEIKAIAVEPDGQIVTAGYATTAGANTDLRVTRLNNNGSIDTTLDLSVAMDAGGTNADVANAVAVLPTGQILLVGTSNTTSNGDDIAVVRMSSTGVLDTNFDSDGKLLLRYDTGNRIDRGTGLAVQADGKYVIGGTVQVPGATDTDLGMFRINSTGVLDTNFDGDGKNWQGFPINETATGLVMQADGKIVISGSVVVSGANTDLAVARFNADGSRDNTFDGDGLQQYAVDFGNGDTATMTGLAIDSVGRIVAGGTVTTTSRGTDMVAVRLFGGDIPLVVGSTADGIDGDFRPAQLTLREAVRLANLGPGADAITFAPGLGPVVLTTAQLTLTDTTGATTISGPTGGTQVVTRSTAGGTPNFRIFNINISVTATLNYLTITNGNDSGGGGILASGSLTVTNSTVSGNTAGGDGGGISSSGTNLTVTNSTVSGNTAGDDGGGISSSGTNLTVTNSTVSGNTAGGDGGGIYRFFALTVTNSTVSGNTAGGDGGGIYAAAGNTKNLSHITAVGNVADRDNNATGFGGFLWSTPNTVILQNSIVAGNARYAVADEISGTLKNFSSFNLIAHAGSAGGLTNGTNGNRVGVNPLLGPLANNGGPTKTHAPLLGSPALGEGSATVSGYSVFDQRGTPRDLLSPDMGAYEVQHTLASVGGPTSLAAMYAPKPSASADEAFIKGLFRTTLQREASASDVAAWMPYFGAPFNWNRQQIAYGFVNSTENRNNQVRFFFLYFLGRPADEFGLNYWTAELQRGVDEATVMNGFLLSPEFTQNNTDSQFVTNLYYSILGRTDPGGVTAWVNLLNTGQATRATLANGFLRSQEGMWRIVRSQFQTYLMRDLLDADAFAIYLSSHTFGELAILILSSEEFYANAQINMT